MPGALNLTIPQGQTFDYPIQLFDPKIGSRASTDGAAHLLYDNSFVIPGTGVGSIATGDWVRFTEDTQAYEVLTGIPDLSVGGTLGIQPPGLMIPFPAGNTFLDILIPSDLTGLTAEAVIKQSTCTDEIVATFLCQIDLDPTTGRLNLHLTAEQTAAIPTTGCDYLHTNRYVWDLYLVDVTGYRTRVFNGFVTVSPEATPIE